MSRQKVYGPPRTDFGRPPPGYIPGLGRGATGFTTRSDIGPAAERGVVIPERGMGPAELQRLREREENLNEQNYDEFTGYGGSLFNTGKYDADDKEADRIYAAIDARMESRRKRKEMEDTNKSAAELAMLAVKKSKGQVVADLKNLKQGLTVVSETEWEALPDAVDLTRRPKQGSGRETLAAVPDSVLLSGSVASALEAATGGATSNTVVDDEVMDVTELSRARDKMLSLSLDSLTGQSNTADATEYVSSLDTQATTALGDVKKLRLLYKSVIHSNPTHAPGWIAAARLERDVGRLSTAKQLIHRACENCPKNEDVWLEAIDIYSRDGPGGVATARTIAVDAVRCLPHSSALWRRAAALETMPARQRSVLRKALEVCPADEELWRAAVRLEDPAGAIALLGKAVEALPQSVDMWLALARLESYENAKRVLNRARQVCPDSVDVWLGACLLEEERMKSEAEAAARAQATAIEEARGLRSVKTEMEDESTSVSSSSSSSSTAGATTVASPEPAFYDEELAATQPQWANAATTMASLGIVDRIARIAIKTLMQHPSQAEKSANKANQPSGTISIGSSEFREAESQEQEKLSRGLLPRAQWLERMRECEDNQQYITCAALAGTAALVGLGKYEPESSEGTQSIPGVTVPLSSVTPLTRMLIRRTLYEDAQTLQRMGYPFCAKSLLHLACTVSPDDDEVWMDYVAVLRRELEQWQHGPENRARKAWMEKYREMGDALYTQHGLIPPEKRPSEWREIPVFRSAELLHVLDKAVEASPENIPAWLLLAKQSRAVHSIAKARAVLARGFEMSPNAAALWLAAAKLEAEHGLIARAITIYRTALATTGSARVAVKYAKLLRAIGRATLTQDAGNGSGRGAKAVEQLVSLLESLLGVAWEGDRAVVLSPEKDERDAREGRGRVAAVKGMNWKAHREEAKLWMLLGQTYADNARQNDTLNAGTLLTGARALTRAREVYRAATRICPNSEPLWVQAAELEVDGVLGANVRPMSPPVKSTALTAIARARAVLDAARAANPTSALVWLALCRTEALAGSTGITAVTQQLARALQTASDKSMLYEYAVAREAPVQRRGRVAEALSKCPEDARVCCIAARLFWSEGKTGKARGWFEKAVMCGSTATGTSNNQEQVKEESKGVSAARVSKRGYGDVWMWWCAFEQEQVARAREALESCIATLQSVQAGVSAGIKSEGGACAVKTDAGVWGGAADLDSSPHVQSLKAELVKAEARVEALLQLCETATPAKGEMWTALSKRDKVDLDGLQGGLRPTVEEQTNLYEGIKVLSWSPREIVLAGASRIEDVFGGAGKAIE